jgi:uncharacterized protein
MSHKHLVIIYHADCPDGFGSAYAAWKKFGDSAEYVPADHHALPEVELDGKDLYLVDICYAMPMMQELLSRARSVTVLDHHRGVRDVAEQMPAHIFDDKRSGATITWSYFHPETSVPTLLQYVQDGDLYTFKLPHAREYLAYLYVQPFTFESWDELRTRMEDESERAKIRERGAAYVEYGDLLKTQVADRAWLVSFEGHEILAVDVPGFFVSDVGHILAERKGPFALLLRMKRDGIRVSLRGDGTIDVSEIARKYGGNGHPNAAAFLLPLGGPLPFTAIHHHAAQSTD